MYYALYFPMFIFTFTFHDSLSFQSFIIENQCCWSNQSSFFWSSKIFFCSFQFSENSHIYNVVLTLVNVAKLDVENNTIVLTLSNLVNINIETDNADSTLFNVDIHNVVSMLIWHCPTLRRHINLTKTLRQRWNICWVLQNVAKRLHSFIKLKTYIFSRIPLNCCFRKLSKRYW